MSITSLAASGADVIYHDGLLPEHVAAPGRQFLKYAEDLVSTQGRPAGCLPNVYGDITDVPELARELSS